MVQKLCQLTIAIITSPFTKNWRNKTYRTLVSNKNTHNITKMKELKPRNVNSFSASIKFSKQSRWVSLTVQLLFKVQDTKSLNLSSGFITLLQVCFVGIAGTGSEEVQVAGSVRFRLFPFGSGAAATDCSLATSEGTLWAVLDADCSLANIQKRLWGTSNKHGMKEYVQLVPDKAM